MENDDLRERIAEINPEALMLPDLDDGIIGVGQQHGGNTVVIYDVEKCIEIFAKQFAESDPEEDKDEDYDPYLQAVEWMDYNVINAYLGPNTPIFLTTLDSI